MTEIRQAISGRPDNNSSARGRRIPCRIASALLTLAVLLISVFAFGGCGRSGENKVFSDAGKAELERFVRLGVFPAGTDAKVSDNITRFDAVLALERLLGAGDELRAADYFRQLAPEGSIDLFEDPDGSSADAESAVSAAQAYHMCLKALGLPGDTAPETAGFGYYAGTVDGDKLTYGSYSLILSELLGLRPEGSAEPVYRITAAMDSAFLKLLRNNGLYDDIPEELAPVFGAGYYVPDSFAAVNAAYSEWSAQYSKVSAEALEAYIDRIEAEGWIPEGQYTPESEPDTKMYLYYQPNSDAPDGEMGLVLRLTPEGMLTWALLA